MLFTVFVDAQGDSPAPETALDRLRLALAGEARELACSPYEWTGLFTVEAGDLDQAADAVRRRAAAADDAAGLPTWHCNCFEVRETLLRLDDDLPHWRVRVPHWHAPRPHRHRSTLT